MRIGPGARQGQAGVAQEGLGLNFIRIGLCGPGGGPPGGGPGRHLAGGALERPKRPGLVELALGILFLCRAAGMAADLRHQAQRLDRGIEPALCHSRVIERLEAFQQQLAVERPGAGVDFFQCCDMLLNVAVGQQLRALRPGGMPGVAGAPRGGCRIGLFVVKFTKGFLRPFSEGPRWA